MMKPLMIIGLVLMLLGVVTLSYEGFSYTQQEKVAQIGDLKITTDETKRIHFPPVLGGACLVAGFALIIIGRGRK